MYIVKWNKQIHVYIVVLMKALYIFINIDIICAYKHFLFVFIFSVL